jgi:CRISPR/Cas system-associated exonuclease Cas4 (RecB family)
VNATNELPVIPDLAAELREAHVRLLRSHIRASPTLSVRASAIGNECARQLFYEQTAHEKRVMHEPELQALFDLGNHLEGYVTRVLEEMGYVVEQRNRSFHDREHNITGHLDGRIWHRSWPRERKSVPIEIKGLNPYTADRIANLEDIKSSRQAWVRKYYAQLQMYERLDGDELGVFVLLNKSTGWLEFIECPIDRPYIEQLLARADLVKAAVAKDEPPERHRTIDCRRCPFVHVCLPDIDFGPGVQLVDEPELIEAIAQREAHREAKRAFDAADRALKTLLELQTKKVKESATDAQLLVGPYALKGKLQKRDGHVVKPFSFVQWEVDQVAEPAPAPTLEQTLTDSVNAVNREGEGK